MKKRRSELWLLKVQNSSSSHREQASPIQLREWWFLPISLQVLMMGVSLSMTPTSVRSVRVHFSAVSLYGQPKTLVSCVISRKLSLLLAFSKTFFLTCFLTCRGAKSIYANVFGAQHHSLVLSVKI